MSSLSPLKILTATLFHQRWTRNFRRSGYLSNKTEAVRPSSGSIIIIRSRDYSVVPRRPLFQPPSPTMANTLTTTRATPDSSAASPSNKTVRVVIKGRVQGVFYRDWTVENATQLGLKGWVRNRRDGSVEALFSGDADKVQEMEQRCRLGPRDALVTALQVFPSDDDPGTKFERKQTATIIFRTWKYRLDTFRVAGYLCNSV